ncbi:MAG: DUF3750 domain-containing protein [Alphaproteobacteria bacterium]|nr:DUF3750 domain-containing protein [Alphaproteobacteria bacterium]
MRSVLLYWFGMRVLSGLLLFVGLLLIGPLVTLASGQVRFDNDWRTASHHVAGIAPDPAERREAIIQVYAARAFNWRAAFGVHTWIAIKPENAPAFTVYEVVGWNAYRGGDAVVASVKPPDTHWYDAPPEVIGELRGPEAAAAIPRVLAAVKSYPYRRLYRAWPGPNSNTFVAHIARHVPELRLDLPPTAIGKDYIPGGGVFAKAPSGTGYQVSLFGILGVLAAVEEGLEVNILALTAGIDPLDLALKIPGIGRVGFGTGTAG